MKSPFPYFGGKSKIAALVWEALGDVAHYIEPFFGSGAVLLNRPFIDNSIRTETVNDSDGSIANVWRSLKFSPAEVAKWCDWPVNHADLMARKKEIIKRNGYLLEGLIYDPEWHDAKIAGYWIWSASCWIGSGLTRPGQIPHITDRGEGVHASNSNINEWFKNLSRRLRHVRVVCGDWSRVCGGNWQSNLGIVGIFFDPPYAIEDRTKDIYSNDSVSVAHEVRKWCIERGANPSYRIVLTGYDEHEELKNFGWYKINWKTGGGYGNSGDGQGKENSKRETIWFSPHCLKMELFQHENKK